VTETACLGSRSTRLSARDRPTDEPISFGPDGRERNVYEHPGFWSLRLERDGKMILKLEETGREYRTRRIVKAGDACVTEEGDTFQAEG
jgi:hypothetical protein